MSKFIIHTHGRLQEWVAHEAGYFTAEGLDYELKQHRLLSQAAPAARYAAVGSAIRVPETREGAYQSYEKGREASVSCACHWTVNMAASAQHGRLWGEAYTVTPCAIFVPPDSPYQTPADLAGVEVHVGYQSGSHYTTIQALEPFMKADEIRLKFSGSPADRVDQLLAGAAPAATLFGTQYYLFEQLGWRKLVDCTFMIAAMVAPDANLSDVRRYFQGLRRAQADIDRMHQRFTHFYLNEMPERHSRLVDVRRFGPGERIVFEPYTESMYESTRRWVEERNIFPQEKLGDSDYAKAVATCA